MAESSLPESGKPTPFPLTSTMWWTLEAMSVVAEETSQIELEFEDYAARVASFLGVSENEARARIIAVGDVADLISAQENGS